MSRYLVATETYKLDAVLRVVPKGYCQWCGKLLPKRCTVFCPSILIDGVYSYRTRECAIAYFHFWQNIPRFKRVVFIRDDFTCQSCNLRPTTKNKHGVTFPAIGDLAIDHIRPYSKGGQTIPSNLRVLCRRCNLKKGASLEYAPQGALL